MKEPIERLMILLAASEWRGSDVERLARQIQRIPPSQFTRMVLDVRRALNSSFPPFRSEDQYSELYFQNRRIREGGASVRAEELLRRDINLDVAAAVKLIQAAAKEAGISPTVLPVFRNKEGFSRWLEKVEKEIGGSRLLQIVAKIANARSADAGPDWPLDE